MACDHCTHPDAHQVTLVDGRQCCTWCEDYRHECEARTVLAMPTLNKRREYLYGRLEEKYGRMYRVGGIEQRRGKDALARLEATMTALWKCRVADAKAAVMNRERGQPLAANDNHGAVTQAHEG